MDKKILILLFYYDRPLMVKNALHSLAAQSYQNYEVAFINDTPNVKGWDVLEYVKDHPSHTKYRVYDINQTSEEKKVQGGSIFGMFANDAIKDSDADIIIMLCDDDALVDDYLENLVEFYTHNNCAWTYSKVKYYNPSVETYIQATDNFAQYAGQGSAIDLNSNTGIINPFCRCDASQVSFRRDCFVKGNVWFPYPQTRSLDATIFQKMFEVWGPCHPTNFYGQCKGVFADQLGSRWALGKDQFNVNIK